MGTSFYGNYPINIGDWSGGGSGSGSNIPIDTSTIANAIVNTVSGSSLSIVDGVEGTFNNVSVQIKAIQEGTGDPSPDNVCPINGWTECNINNSGKNLIDDSIEYQESADILALGNEYDYTIPLQEGTYTFHVDFANGYQCAAYIQGENDDSPIALWAANSETDTTTFIITETGNYKIWLEDSNGVTAANVESCQLEAGLVATEYEEYNGNTVTVTWASEVGEIYGGILDVTTGVLTVTHNLIILDGQTDGQKFTDWSSDNNSSGISISNAWDYNQSANTVITEQVLLNAGVQSSATTVGLYTDDNSTFPMLGCYITSDGDVSYQVRWSDGGIVTDVTSANVLAQELYENDTPLAFVYPLAEPQTYQLTPTQVQSLAGENNLCADTGDINVSYNADTKAYIDKKIEEVNYPFWQGGYY